MLLLRPGTSVGMESFQNATTDGLKTSGDGEDETKHD